MKKTYVLFLLIFPSLVYSQIQLDWSLVHHPFGNLSSGAYVVNDQLRLDSQGNVIGGWQYYGSGALGVTSYTTTGSLNWEDEYYGSFGGSNYLYSCVIDSADNVYIMGEVNTSTFSSDDVNIKYDTNGNQQWKVGDDSSGGKGVDIEVVGNSYFNLSRGRYLYQYDKFTGALLDSTAIDTLVANGLSGNEFMVPYSENMYIIGTVGYFTGINTKLYICMVDTSGTIKWKKIVDPTIKEDIAYNAVANQTGNLFVLAKTNAVSANTPESVFTCALDSMGDTLWTRFYNPTPSTEHCYASDILADNMGHVYITANAWDVNTNMFVAAVVQYDAVTGTKNWEVWLDSSVYYNVGGVRLEMDSTGYIYVGYNKFNPVFSNAEDFVIVKIDSMGSILWRSCFDTTGESFAFVFDGKSSFYSGGVKLSKFTLVTAIDENEVPENFLSIYPNPVTDKIFIKNLRLPAGSVYTIYDYAGRNVQTGLDAMNNCIVVKNMKVGMYLLTIQTKENIYRAKFLKR